jgi:16S rRNA processing protein RimM
LAEDLKGQEILVHEENLHPLDKGKYYLFQLRGCSVVTKVGDSVGPVKDVLFIEGNDLLVVERGGRDVFIPFTESICIEIDLKGKRIVIDPPDGLLDLNEI